VVFLPGVRSRAGRPLHGGHRLLTAGAIRAIIPEPPGVADARGPPAGGASPASRAGAVLDGFRRCC